MDSKGLVALWREGLLARKVLEGKTKGYKNHPQLTRFKGAGNSLAAISAYLAEVYKESVGRGYKFDESKVKGRRKTRKKIETTEGQLEYEWQHLRSKLKKRQPDMYKKFKSIKLPEPHPLFCIVRGEKEGWEK